RAALVNTQDVFDFHRHRAVTVVADADAVEPLAIVEVGVLMTQDRADRLLAPARQRADLSGPGELVRQRGQRERHADHAGDLGAPDPGAAHDGPGGDLTLVGHHAGHPRALGADVENLMALKESHAARGRAA